MKSAVTPSVLTLSSVEDMNTTLYLQIYDYFSKHHGVRTPATQHLHHKRHHKSHLEDKLRKLRSQKKELKKQFRKARKQNIDTRDHLISLGKAFHNIVKQHSKL